MSARVVLATRNEHKVHELRRILADLVEELDLEVVGAGELAEAPEVPETEVTFLGNARLKAVALARASGLPALADDSGLAVEVLGGSPGVFSARWSGSHAGVGASRAQVDRANLDLLLEQVADVPDEHRAAAFVCAAVLALPDGRVDGVQGRVEGSLARAPRGEHGFGYDPVFVPTGDTRTLAEYTDEEKNAVSHRGNAFRALAPVLRERLG
ncbi:RdgB/HAM1 family non-canonical purine NTP pyrophosphatase [Phycicoccus endophyticus]|uniref:dITP/XTP pyrophosphatase n=1 Tax=Phycicoccus endophyticus TaxID=1690220 RepID=A0A7G9R3B2_9MICO|nr:RdgB/HAM1 family non-canonical purine NTP pyrophosphatase [Phycicoccus endophyticus]NHI19834.1 RdgB/HAM1 family non-canonical purine NTP pyrophosphatase [Phycicoccus endophyticus]QNN50087.1 RdgB/HAM1 family non-canonical purine NTP pyrophosphatase [Phycicoccus endophyticus]GGL28202.1 non-canonical purine NTP pyrophosphatase [Phycicoccus endophyticus]